MQTTQETTHLFAAMIKAAPEIQSITKSKQAYGYKYATLDALIDMLRGVLPRHGLWFTQMPTREGGKSALTTRVIHESGEWMEDSIEMTDTELQGKSNDTQKVGASITYFRRYALSSIFGVASDEDVDGNLHTAKGAEMPTPKHVDRGIGSDNKALAFILKDYEARKTAGEAVGSILADYQTNIGLEKAKELKDYTGQELKDLANAIYARKR